MDGSVRARKSSSSERSMERKASHSPPPRRHHKQHHHQNLHSSTGVRQRKQHQVCGGKTAAVVYYLSRSWQMEHPHFIEVPNSSPEGLFLRDVIGRLCVLRGKRMAYMYSWSCKRSYKNGFVWHDISVDDLIEPTSGNEYVLKGSEIIDVSPSDRRGSLIPNMNLITTTRAMDRSQVHRLPSSPPPPPEDQLRRSSSSENASPEAIKSIASEKRGGKIASRTNASTQTDATIRCNRRSPPRSDTLEALIRAEPMWSKAAEEEAKVVRAGDILRQILTCGTSTMPDSRPRATVVAAAAASLEMEATGGRRRRREWYSGSFVEMRRRMEKGGRGGGRGGGRETDGILLRRSSSHGENRSYRSPPPPEEIVAKNERKDGNLKCSLKPNNVVDFSQRPVDIAIDESKMRKKKISKGRVRPHVAQSPRASSSNGLSRKDMPMRSASSCTQEEKKERSVPRIQQLKV